LLEMLTIKSDAGEGRVKADEALVRGNPVAPAVSEAGRRLLQTLRALGLVPVLQTADGQEVSPEQGSGADSLSLQVRAANPHDAALVALLGMDRKSLERVVYHQDFVVTNPGSTPLAPGQFLSEDEYQAARARHGGDTFEADTGGEAVRQLLGQLHPGRHDGLVLDAVPVLPPDLRPLVVLDTGNL